MESYTTILEHASFEYVDRKSVFIGEAMPVKTEDEAVTFIEHCRKKYSDANHHVYAYVIRENSLLRYSDDREPQGTAGMPVLDAIRKKGCTDAVVVVTRYFGGTLLGTGGLVRAYTAAAVGALDSAQIITYDVYCVFNINTTYSDYQKIMPVFEEYSMRQESIRYTDGVEVVGRVLKKDSEAFTDKLTQITSGRIFLENCGEKLDYRSKKVFF